MDKILIFGRGKYCEMKLENVKKKYDVLGMVDNAVIDREFDEKYGCEVINPYNLKDYIDCQILCMSASYIDMWKQLISIGISADRILFGVNMLPFCSLQDEELFGERQELIAKNEYIIYRDAPYGEIQFSNINEFNKGLREIFAKKKRNIKLISDLDIYPVCRNFGTERGTAVDRYYIEMFLAQNADKIKGTVMEIADSQYTRMFGKSKVKKELVLHVEGWGKNSIKGNFETGEGIEENMVDCLICTQTLQYIYNLKSAIKNIYRLLRPNGAALITVPGIKALCIPDNQNWGERWSFTKESMRQLCLEVCQEESFSVESFGNVKIATAYLYGICREELTKEDFQYNDPQFPFIICVKLTKKAV